MQLHTNPFPGGMQNLLSSGKELMHYAGFIKGHIIMKNSGTGGRHNTWRASPRMRPPLRGKKSFPGKSSVIFLQPLIPGA